MGKKILIIVLCLIMLFSLSACNDAASLKEKYPEYFGLSTFKGLEVYVWQMAPESYSFGLMEGTNRWKTPEELMNLKGVSTEEMKGILSSYDIPDENVFIIPYQHPVSSYIPLYWTVQQGESEESIAARKQEYIDNIRKMLFD